MNIEKIKNEETNPATGHTPGPWEMHSPTEGNPTTGDGSYCVTAARDGGVLAKIVPQDWHETPANARLIAAAPALLEAAQAMYELHKDGVSHQLQLFQRRAALTALRAAIAAATGEEE